MRIICFGDSITYGQNVPEAAAWPSRLAWMTGHDVRNAGVCGDTTRLALERWEKHVALHRPDRVVIQFGHNDANIWQTDLGQPRVAGNAYAANIVEMCERARSWGARPLVIEPHWTERHREYNLRLRSYWLGVEELLDDSLLIPRPHISLLNDGYDLHPDEEMHLRIARLVKRAL